MIRIGSINFTFCHWYFGIQFSADAVTEPFHGGNDALPKYCLARELRGAHKKRHVHVHSSILVSRHGMALKSHCVCDVLVSCAVSL